MKTLAIDLGNFNIKTSESISFNAQFKEGIDTVSTERNLNFDNKDYIIEDGEWQFETDKVSKNYMPYLLYAIHKSTNENDINLVLGVPINQMGRKDKLISELKDKTFKFTIGDINREITIHKIAVVAEGYSSLFTLPDSVRSNDILLLDIGGGTINVLTYSNKKIIDRDTMPFGMFSFYNSLEERFVAEGKETDKKNIERLLDKNKIPFDIEPYKDVLVDRIVNRLKDKKIDYTTYDIYVTGGGSLRLNSALIRKLGMVTPVPNPLFSNCLGNLNIANTQWGE
ncbi:MAG: ParM/StbA family protein [Bacilli bacterium]|nr:ParM/StbA family protein [Bacilli bacterium]